MPENTPPAGALTPRVDEHLVSLTAVHKPTGEVVARVAFDLAGPARDLAAGVRTLRELEGQAADLRRELELELARRVDRTGARTAVLDGVELKVNAPTETRFDAVELHRRLEALVDAGTIDRAMVDTLLREKVKRELVVDGRRVKTAATSPIPEVREAIAAVRTVGPARRTVEVVGFVPDATAEEEVS